MLHHAIQGEFRVEETLQAMKDIIQSRKIRKVAVAVKLSDASWREFRGETLAHAITARRLEEVRRMLAKTNLSIRTITSRCGFTNTNHLKNLFKKRIGMPMGEWRIQNRPS